MGVKSLFVCFILYQTAITSLAGVTLPFSELIGVVTPIKPKPLSSSSPSPVHDSPLIWDGEDIMAKLFSPIAGGSVFREFVSPLTLTACSRTLPEPKIDSAAIANLKVPERLNKKLVSTKVKSLSGVPKNEPFIINSIPDISLPRQSTYKSSSRRLPSCSLPEINSFSSNKLLSLPKITSLPTVSPFKRGGTDSISSATINNEPTTYKKSIETYSPSELSSNMSPFSLSLPYPFYYKSKYLPRVKTPSEIPLKYKPTSYTAFGKFNSQPCSRNRNSKSFQPISMPSSSLSSAKIGINIKPDCFGSSLLPKTSISSSNFATKYNFADRNVFPNYFAKSNINTSSKNIDIPVILPLINSYVETVDRMEINDKFQNDFNDIRYPEELETIIMMSSPLTLSPNSYLSSERSQDPPTPTYLNISPPSSLSQSSSNIVSSINNIVSEITQDILSSCESNSNSPSPKVSTPKYKFPANPYSNTQKIESVTQSVNEPIDSSYSATEFPMIISLDIPKDNPSAIEIPCLSSSISSSLSLTSSPLITCLSPPVIPSYSPSPRLPIISSPVYMEPPVIKLSSPDKDRAVDKLIELLLLTEILDNDESFNWDDLDTLLALLSVS